MDYSTHEKLEFRRKFWKLVGAEITVVDPASDALVGFISAKAWRLREDVRLYRNRDMQEEVLRIGARSIIDFGATYDVFAADSQTPRFSLRRKGLRSTFVRDHWVVTDGSGTQIASVIETSSALALFRRWIGLIPFIGDIIDLALAFAPQSYRIADMDNKLIGTILRRKNPFIVKMELSLTGAETTADQFIGPAICSLLSIVDTDK